MDIFEQAKKSQEKDLKKIAKEEKTFITANFDGLCDLIEDQGEIKFLLTTGQVVDQMIIEDKVFTPPTKLDLDYLIPNYQKVLNEARKHSSSFTDDKIKSSNTNQAHSDVTDVTDDQQGCPLCLELYEEVKKYHQSISELPDPLYDDLLTLWDFHTYLIEKFNFSPILYFFADKERGKTRTAKGLIYIARRGIMTETLREANLIRWSRDHRATLLFDVKNFPKKLESAAAEDLIYGRAEKGVIASRVLYPEKGAFRDTVRFEVFGPTVVTSNRMIDDIGLSRTITLEMKPSSKVFITEPSPQLALPLKEKLLGMRLAHLEDQFVEINKQETGRLEDMLIGYLRMIRTLYPPLEPIYIALKEMIKEQKQETAMDSFEAQILETIINLESMVESGTAMLPYETICSIYNEGKRENTHVDPRGMGRITKGMGFISKRNSQGTKRGIFYDIELLRKLKNIYGLNYDTVSSYSKINSISIEEEVSNGQSRHEPEKIQNPYNNNDLGVYPHGQTSSVTSVTSESLGTKKDSQAQNIFEKEIPF